jgi:hypothetical protein
VILNYWFSPLPWQVRGLLDLYGLGESFVRLVLVWGLLLSFRKIPKEMKFEHLLLVGLYLLVELMWAAGTANWGTAFRHRVVGYGLLVVLGGIGWVSGYSSALPQEIKVSARAKARRLRRAKNEQMNQEP